MNWQKFNIDWNMASNFSYNSLFLSLPIIFEYINNRQQKRKQVQCLTFSTYSYFFCCLKNYFLADILQCRFFPLECSNRLLWNMKKKVLLLLVLVFSHFPRERELGRKREQNRGTKMCAEGESG